LNDIEDVCYFDPNSVVVVGVGGEIEIGWDQKDA